MFNGINLMISIVGYKIFAPKKVTFFILLWYLVIIFISICVIYKFHCVVDEVFKRLMPKSEDFSRALYTFDIGQNDLTAGLFQNLSLRQVRESVPDILGQFKTVIKVSVSLLIFVYNIYEPFQKQILWSYNMFIITFCNEFSFFIRISIIKEAERFGYTILVHLGVYHTSSIVNQSQLDKWTNMDVWAHLTNLLGILTFG